MKGKELKWAKNTGEHEGEKVTSARETNYMINSPAVMERLFFRTIPLEQGISYSYLYILGIQ